MHVIGSPRNHAASPPCSGLASRARDATRPEPGMPEADAAIRWSTGREMVGHPRAPTLARPERLQLRARPASSSGNTSSDARRSTGTLRHPTVRLVPLLEQDERAILDGLDRRAE